MDGYTEVFAWGSDCSGQLGLAHKEKVRAYSLPRFCCFNVVIKAVSCGERHSAFVEAKGLIYTIGENEGGRLGVGKVGISHSRSPCLVEALASVKVVDVSCGGGHTLALDESGRVYSWGIGDCGALGCGSTETHFSPVEVALPRSFVAVSVSAGGRHSAVVGDLAEKAGLLLTFGAGEDGQLGTGRRDMEPNPCIIPTTEPVKQVSSGRSHTLFTSVFGKVFATGANERGQLGLNSRRSVCLPTQVPGLEGVSVMKVVAGGSSAALGNDGTVFVWGDCPSGDLLMPAKLVLSRPAIDISIGSTFGAVIDNAFQVWTWGRNDTGELGLGDFSTRSQPSNVSALHSKKVKSVACGGGFVLALGCDVKKALPSTLPYRLSKPDIPVHSSTKTTSRPTTPYEPSNVYDSMPTSTREVRIRPAKPAENSDFDAFIKKLEARLSVDQVQKTAGNSGEEKAKEWMKLLDCEKSKVERLESELQRVNSAWNEEKRALEDRLRAKEVELAAITRSKDMEIAAISRAKEVEIGAIEREKEELRLAIIGSTGKEVKALKEELMEKNETIRRLEVEVERREGEVLSLQAQVDKHRTDLSQKSHELHELSMTLSARNSEIFALETADQSMKTQLESALRQVTAQLQDSEVALRSAKTEIEMLRKQTESDEIRGREAAEECRGLKEEVETLREKLTQKLKELAESVEKKGSLEREVAGLKNALGTNSVEQGQLRDVQDQYNRLMRDYKLLKDSLQRCEDHNKQLLEALDQRTLSKAREFREKSLNVLNTPSPLRSRPRSPVPAGDENCYKPSSKPQLSVPQISSRLLRREQSLEKTTTPPTFRESSGFQEDDRGVIDRCRKAVV